MWYRDQGSDRLQERPRIASMVKGPRVNHLEGIMQIPRGKGVGGGERLAVEAIREGGYLVSLRRIGSDHRLSRSGSIGDDHIGTHEYGAFQSRGTTRTPTAEWPGVRVGLAVSDPGVAEVGDPGDSVKMTQGEPEQMDLVRRS